MLFGDSASRKRYFEDLQLGRRQVNYGDALAHARSTNLGIWGDRNGLEYDCAAVMAHEVRRYHRESGNPGRFTCDAQDVCNTEPWRHAFRLARLEPDNQLENACTQALPACHGRELLRDRLTAAEIRELGGIHVAIYYALRGRKRRHLRRLEPPEIACYEDHA